MKIALKTLDGQTFSVERSVITKSITIKNLLDEGCGKTLSKVIEYLSKHTELTEAEINTYDENFTKGFNMEEIFALIMAANFLHIKELLDLVSTKIADSIKDKTPEEVRQTFNIKNDFTPEEEAAVRNENAWAFEDLKKDA